ncbi:MAG: hypothetical protein PWQ76_296 [Clostridiales bacterium]|jgi:uncharacterized protein (DUF697 family)|nr:hypothetical protein [Oscillospiraceae bacterium]MDN5378043.1 hypothetical protein [Clostridiales bacterium]
MTEKINEMLKVLKDKDCDFRKNNCKSYFVPDITNDLFKKLVKYFDDNLSINNVIAFFDNTIFSTGKSGFLFTSDGFYYRFIGKAIYFQYSDIFDMRMEGENLIVELENSNISEYKFIDVFNMFVLRKILSELIIIDSSLGKTSNKMTGKVKKIDLPPDKLKKCNKIIHAASVACGGVGTGLAQIPSSDNAVIVPIQIGMIISLGNVFELNITESVAKSIIASAGATIAGRTISQFLVGWIPVIGNVINTATAAGITEAIGWIAVKNFYERWIQDRNKGRYEGMKDGYNEASAEYESKLRKQAEEFLSQMKDVKKEKEEYEKLLSEYETYIQDLEEKCDKNTALNEIKLIYNDLKKLKI